MDKTSMNCGKTLGHGFDALLNQKLGTSPAPRMLTPSREIELLRQEQGQAGDRGLRAARTA